MQKMKQDKIEGLNDEDCKSVDRKELAECLDEINKEECGSPIDSIGRMAACRSSDLCKATTVP